MSDCHEGSWIGVDLDGTLAHYDGWKGVEHIGDPIPEMVERVKAWLLEGVEVRIFTARVSLVTQDDPDEWQTVAGPIVAWCIKHLGEVLPITHEKDMKMYELWDDRCVCVERNTGHMLGRNP